MEFGVVGFHDLGLTHVDSLGYLMSFSWHFMQGMIDVDTRYECDMGVYRGWHENDAKIEEKFRVCWI